MSKDKKENQNQNQNNQTVVTPTQIPSEPISPTLTTVPSDSGLGVLMSERNVVEEAKSPLSPTSPTSPFTVSSDMELGILMSTAFNSNVEEKDETKEPIVIHDIKKRSDSTTNGQSSATSPSNNISNFFCAI